MNTTPRDTASILYPDDAPASPAGQGQATNDGAAALYQNNPPNGQGGQQPAQAQAEGAKDEPATLSYKDAAPFDARELTSFFDQTALDAIKNGDRERAAELGQAGKVLTAEFKTAGTPSGFVNEALRAFNDASYSGVTEAPEAILSQLSQEFGPTLESDLAAARALIIELDRKAPGLIQSLEHTGAGNDPRLIRQAIREAKRRGIKG